MFSFLINCFKPRRRKIKDYDLIKEAVIEFNKNDEIKKYNEECSMCLSPMLQTDKVVKLKCGHAFHKLCLSLWYLKEPTCPMCREFVSQL